MINLIITFGLLWLISGIISSIILVYVLSDKGLRKKVPFNFKFWTIIVSMLTGPIMLTILLLIILTHEL